MRVPSRFPTRLPVFSLHSQAARLTFRALGNAELLLGGPRVVASRPVSRIAIAMTGHFMAPTTLPIASHEPSSGYRRGGAGKAAENLGYHGSP